jgi:murein DD-endopeptidase MepM/ murein hydrolase activator NlpD
VNNIGTLTGYNYLSGFKVNLDSEARKFFHNKKENPLLDPEFCENWVRYLAKKNDHRHCYGGYMENRSFLWKGSYLKPKNSIHVGVDFSFKVGTPIYGTVPFKVWQVYRDFDQNGGWGERVLIKTEKGLVIFAHLCGVSIEANRDTVYPKGTFIGTVATSYTNGGWFPHLHLQGIKNEELITHLDGYSSLYKNIKKDYPDPLPILNII